MLYNNLSDFLELFDEVCTIIMYQNIPMKVLNSSYLFKNEFF